MGRRGPGVPRSLLPQAGSPARLNSDRPELRLMQAPGPELGGIVASASEMIHRCKQKYEAPAKPIVSMTSAQYK